MTWLDTLNQMKKEKGMTIEDVSNTSGIPKGTLNKLFSGQTKDPQLSTIKDVVHSLGYTLDDLDPKESNDINNAKHEILNEEDAKHLEKYHALDVHVKDIVDTILDKEYNHLMAQKRRAKAIEYMEMCKYEMPAGAGIGSYLQDECKTIIKIPANEITRQADFALPVSGDSMEPDFHDGDTVLVKSMQNINIGEIGIFIINGDAYIKELGENRLISLNEKYDDIVFKEYDDIRCVGKVLGTV